MSTEALPPELDEKLSASDSTQQPPPGSKAPSHRFRAIVWVPGAAVLTVLAAALVILRPWVPAHVKLADRVLAAVQSGEITSYPEPRDGETDRFEKAMASIENLRFWKRWNIVIFAKPRDIEMPALLAIGKIRSYRLLLSEDLPWQYTPDAMLFDTPDHIALANWYREWARQGDLDQKSKKPMVFGETARSLNPRDVTVDGKPALIVDDLILAKRLEYLVETPTSFFKVSFVVDKKSIYVIDVHK